MQHLLILEDMWEAEKLYAHVLVGDPVKTRGEKEKEGE
jgi:hypothetical protein